MRRSITFILILLGSALILVLAFAAQLVFSTTLTFPHALAISLGHWQIPFLIAAVAAVVSIVFPFRRPRRIRSLIAHTAVLLVLLAVAGHLEYQRLPFLPSQPRQQGPREFRFHLSVENRRQSDLPPERGQVAARHNRRVENTNVDIRVPFRRPQHPPRQSPFWTILATSRWQLHLAAFLTSATLAQAWLLHHRLEERDRRALELSTHLSRAKLHSLRLQLQPHFLFNTLNAISTLVHTAPDTADEMIVNLSQLLRASLDTTVHEHPLRAELATLDIYLQIEQTRLSERLKIERDIAPETLDAQVPALLLQPIVENAIRHAIEPLPGGGTLSLSAKIRDNTLLVAIADNGPGLPPAGKRTDRIGIGLANSEARLRELYGSAATLDLCAPAAGGLRVEIQIPFHTTPTHPEEKLDAKNRSA